MRLPPPDAEPAVRDPRKLRNTAFILLGMMIVGGLLVLLAYGRWSKAQSKDERPAVIYRITPERDLRMMRQDGKIVNLMELRGKVVVLNVTSLRDPQASELSMGVMKRLAEKNAGSTEVTMVTLIVDPIPGDKLSTTLADTAAKVGMHLPTWWLGSNEPATLHKFIKNELKVGVFPHEADGKWNYDSSVVLIDKNGHIRRAVIPQKRGGQPYVAEFDFEEAAKWDAKGVKTGTELDNTGELERLLNATIVKLLAEPFKPS